VGAPVSGSPWHSLTPDTLWSQIRQDAFDYFDFSLASEEGADELVEKYGIQKMSLLRRFCQIMGIQVKGVDEITFPTNWGHGRWKGAKHPPGL